jgi:hypothetical protein
VIAPLSEAGLYFDLMFAHLCKTFWFSHLSEMKLAKRGARKLTGENLKVVWAEFSTLIRLFWLRMSLQGIVKHTHALS